METRGAFRRGPGCRAGQRQGTTKVAEGRALFTPAGNEGPLKAAMKTIVERRWPDLKPDAVPFVPPRWEAVNAWKDL